MECMPKKRLKEYKQRVIIMNKMNNKLGTKWTINNESKSRVEENSIEDMGVNVMVIMLCSFNKHS